MAFRFEKLEIWKLAIDYSEVIYTLIKRFPEFEKYGLASDLNRASLSISTNIAEGSGSNTNNEFKRYLNIARKSLFETISQLIVAKRRKNITDDDFQEVYCCGELLVKKVNSFKNTLK